MYSFWHLSKLDFISHTEQYRELLGDWQNISKSRKCIFTQLRRRIKKICTNLKDDYYKNNDIKNIDKSLPIVIDASPCPL